MSLSYSFTLLLHSVELLATEEALSGEGPNEGLEISLLVGSSAVSRHSVDEILEPDGDSVHRRVSGKLSLGNDAGVLIVEGRVVTKAKEGVDAHISNKMGPGDVGNQGGEGDGGEQGGQDEELVSGEEEADGIIPVVHSNNVRRKLGNDDVRHGLNKGGEVHEEEGIGGEGGGVVPGGIGGLEGMVPEAGDHPEEVDGKGSGDSPEGAPLEEAVEGVGDGQEGGEDEAQGEVKGRGELVGEGELAEEAEGHADVGGDGEEVDVFRDPSLVGNVKGEDLVQDAEEVGLDPWDDQPPVDKLQRGEKVWIQRRKTRKRRKRSEDYHAEETPVETLIGARVVTLRELIQAEMGEREKE